MKVYCLGYFDTELDKWIECNAETTVRSYSQLHDNPDWMEFSPALRLINGELAIFSQCIDCAEEEAP